MNHNEPLDQEKEGYVFVLSLKAPADVGGSFVPCMAAATPRQAYQEFDRIIGQHDYTLRGDWIPWARERR